MHLLMTRMHLLPIHLQAVVFPKSTGEVQEIVRLCARDKMPIIPSGACTSLEGHLAALQGGIAINMREMNQVLEVNTDDMDVRAQAGLCPCSCCRPHVKALPPTPMHPCLHPLLHRLPPYTRSGRKPAPP